MFFQDMIFFKNLVDLIYIEGLSMKRSFHYSYFLDKCEENLLETFPDDLFSICPHVKEEKSNITKIRLMGQKITEFHINDLHQFPNARELDMSYSKISKVHGSSINSGLHTIKNINLRNNQIKDLREGSLDGMFSLESFNLEDNPITNYDSVSWPFCYLAQQPLLVIQGNVEIFKYYGQQA